MENGGVGRGGLKFEGKVRRSRFEGDDLVYGHVGGMDRFGRGLKGAEKLMEDGVFEDVIEEG